MLVLGPRAIERLENHTPPWPLPKIFRLTEGGKLIDWVFRGETLNTPSMLCVEDVLDALRWAEGIGGLPALRVRSDANLATVTRWIETSNWAGFLAIDPATRSNTSICVSIIDPWLAGLSASDRAAMPKKMAALLEAEGAGFDVNGYRDAPPGLRIWGGATVEAGDIEALLPWLDWAFGEVKASASNAA